MNYENNNFKFKEFKNEILAVNTAINRRQSDSFIESRYEISEKQIRQNHILNKDIDASTITRNNEKYCKFLNEFNNAVDNSDLYNVKNSIFKKNNENESKEKLSFKRYPELDIVPNFPFQKNSDPYFDIENANLSIESYDNEEEKGKATNEKGKIQNQKKENIKNINKQKFIIFKKEQIKQHYEFLSTLGKGKIKRSLLRN